MMPTKSLIKLIMLGSVIYITAIILSGFAEIPFELVIRDLAQSCQSSLGVGFISSLGYLLWIFSASIALFTSNLLISRKDINAKMFTLYGGILSLVLCIDDIFLLHDRCHHIDCGGYLLKVVPLRQYL